MGGGKGKFGVAEINIGVQLLNYNLKRIQSVAPGQGNTFYPLS